MKLDAKIESILFWRAEPMTQKKLATILSVTEDEIKAALIDLEKNLEGRGLQLIFKENEVMLSTHKDMSKTIKVLIKEELVRDLGKAGLETLSIIVYKGPISRREIDYIRGVNSNFILRNLQVRGLVEKIPNPSDQRSFVYKPTFELLSYLGISKIEELPEYQDVRAEIENYKKQSDQEDQQTKHSEETAEFEGISPIDLNSEIGQDSKQDSNKEDNESDVSL